MAVPVLPVNLANPTTIQAPVLFSAAGNKAKDGSFQTMFNTAINTVENTSNQADKALEDFLSGNTEDVHSTVMATQRADLTFELFMQVRNKMISAYQEIMRMQV